MKIRILILAVVITAGMQIANAQDIPVHPTKTGFGTFLGETRPLRDIPELTSKEKLVLKAKAIARQFNLELSKREYPFADVALPKGPDAVWQKTMSKAAASSPSVNFEGQSSPYYPPDACGTAGPNHYMQTINCTYAIYDKAGNKLAGPTNMNQLFNGVPGANYNDGDPIILYDEQADRWVACEFTIGHSNDVMLMAVSSTNDPTGTWYAYSFDIDNNPDYPKFSVWQDGYYMSDNKSSGRDTYVFERSQMLTGASSPKFVGFDNPSRPGSIDGFMCVPPVDNDGAFAPAGSPGLFIAMSDDAFGGGTDQLWIYELAVNWDNTASSTFSRVQQLDVAPFDSNFGNNWNNIKQLGTSQELDAVPAVIMNVPQYRNFGSYQTLVCCHTVDVDASDHAGIRWYELRKTPPSTTWTIRQQGTFAPDIHSRWMGSIMLNGYNEIGLGYSISSTTMYPGIRYTGQTAAEYDNHSGILDLPEGIIIEGTGSQTGYNRWGDYAQLSVDPADDGTFWFTTEYAQGGRKTQIASFLVGPILPNAEFSASNTLPCKGSSVVAFTSQATGSPTSYVWAFTPSTVTYTAGTDSSSTAPVVIFNELGTYTVSLTVSTAAGSRTITKDNYIQVNAANADFTSNATEVVVNNLITFDDASTCQVTSWHWDFGTGATPATADTKGPHTVLYSTTGLKTITLTVNGNSTKTKTDFINVVDAAISMSNATVSTCGATFFDPGGASGNYGNDENYSMLFIPGITGSKLQAQFTSFALEASTGCTKDYLKIYDGTTETATKIGTYCGNTSPGTVTATNPEGALLFVFHSNTQFNFDGWVANVICTAIPVANPAVFTALPQSSSQINLGWSKNPANDDVLLAWSANGNFGTPVAGTVYTAGSVLPGGGTVLAAGAANTFNHTALASSTKYYYEVFSYNTDKIYSGGVLADATTFFQPTLTVDPQNINVTSPAGTAPVNITSNAAWTVTSNQTWCTVTPSGTGAGIITATYQQNLSVSPRIALITISVTGLPAVIVTLTQAGAAPILVVTPPIQNVTDPSGNTAFTVTSNTSWVVTSDQAWCTVTNSGTGNGTIATTFTQNLALTSRSANISVTVNGIPTIIVKVTQAGAAPTLTVSPEIRNVNAYASSTDFTVTSNTTWTATADSAWCVVTPSGSGNGKITAVYPWNPSKKVRSTKISVQAAGVTTQIATLIQGQETASVPENGSKGLSIYPNPAKGLFSIVVDAVKYPSMMVTISDAHGSTVLTRNCKGESEYKFDLSNSPQGTYLVKVQTDKELLVTKLVILR